MDKQDKKQDHLASVNATLDRFAKLIEENAQQLIKDKAEFDRRLAKDREEYDRKLAKDKEAYDRKLAKDKAEFDRQLAEDRANDEKRQQDWDKRFADISGQVGGQGSAIGDITEAMTVSDNIIDLVNKFEGIKVTNFSFNTRKKYQSKNSKGKTILKPFEIDGLADGKRVAIVIEAKTTLTTEYVKNFITKLAKFKDAYPEHKHKDLYGAVTFVRADEQALTLSKQHGLFIIKTSPPDVELVNDEDFKPTKVVSEKKLTQ